VISATLDNATHGELRRCENNYKAFNLITTALGRNVMIESLIYKLLMMCGLNCAIPMRPLLRLSICIEILTTGNIRHFLRNRRVPR
jgi:hypothetical protein